MAPIPGAVVDNLSAIWRRSWHAVATSEEVGVAPLQVWLLGRAWCLVRLGLELVAFDDCCAPRLAPLPAGRVCGDALGCGYHRWQFVPSGRCAAMGSVGAPHA